MKNEDLPHAKRRGWLKYGNLPGDPSKAPRCRAKTRRQSSCLAPAMKNGRCRLHGGKSTGPRTEVGKARSRSANLKDGHYTTEAKARRQRDKMLNENAREVLMAYQRLENE